MNDEARSNQPLSDDSQSPSQKTPGAGSPIWRVEITPQLKADVSVGKLLFATRRNLVASKINSATISWREFLNQYGVGGNAAALTNVEAKWLLRFGSLERARGRITAARDARIGRGNSEVFRGEAGGTVNAGTLRPPG